MDTEYSKSEMINLSEEMGVHLNELYETENDLTTQVNIVQGNWVENDTQAQQVLADLVAKKDELVKELNEAEKLITQYLNAVQAQVEEYTVAENRISAAIGSN